MKRSDINKYSKHKAKRKKEKRKQKKKRKRERRKKVFLSGEVTTNFQSTRDCLTQLLKLGAFVFRK
jgi:hypothetical protein